MTATIINITDSLSLEQQTFGDLTTLYYGTILGGDLFFARRLNSDDWENSTDGNKLKALYQATRLIDQLNYRGDKTDDEQLLEFPRGLDTEVPEDIENAAYLIGHKLLQGYNIDKEFEKHFIEKSKFTNQLEIQRKTYTNTPAYAAAGIPSLEAWRLLLPYLRTYDEVDLVRIS